MHEVFLDSPTGQIVRINDSSLLKKGGNGSAFLLDSTTVIKIFHEYDPAVNQKLLDFLEYLDEQERRGKSVPHQVIVPLRVAYDRRGIIAGFTMEYLGQRNKPMWEFIQHTYRKSYRITPAQVAKCFLAGIPVMSQLHDMGIVVGDHNHRNTFHELDGPDGPQWKLIDSDSFAFGRYGSEGDQYFLAPELHGIDLTNPVFKPGHDWFSFAVMLHWAITMGHPFAGAHRRLRKLTDRVAQRVSVFSRDVIYSDDALPLSTFTPALARLLQGYFEQDRRDPIPTDILEEFIAAQEGRTYKPVAVPAPLPQVSVVSEQIQTGVVRLISTTGSLLHTLVADETVFAIADEDGTAVYYELPLDNSFLASTNVARRIPLFSLTAGTRVGLIRGTSSSGMATSYLVVNLPYTERLRIFEISSRGTTELPEVLTGGIYLGSGQTIFRTSHQYLYHMVAHELFATSIVNGRVRKNPVRSFRQRQTWFAVDPVSTTYRAVVMYHKFDQSVFRYVEGISEYDVPIAELSKNESLLDISVRFDSNRVLIIRRTQRLGEEYIRYAVVSNRGQLRFESAPVPADSPDNLFNSIHGRIYRVSGETDLILHPTQAGIRQQRVQENVIREINIGNNVVNDSVRLYQGICKAKRWTGIIVDTGAEIIRIG